MLIDTSWLFETKYIPLVSLLILLTNDTTEQSYLVSVSGKISKCLTRQPDLALIYIQNSHYVWYYVLIYHCRNHRSILVIMVRASQLLYICTVVVSGVRIPILMRYSFMVRLRYLLSSTKSHSYSLIILLMLKHTNCMLLDISAHYGRSLRHYSVKSKYSYNIRYDSCMSPHQSEIYWSWPSTHHCAVQLGCANPKFRWHLQVTLRLWKCITPGYYFWRQAPLSASLPADVHAKGSILGK